MQYDYRPKWTHTNPKHTSANENQVFHEYRLQPSDGQILLFFVTPFNFNTHTFI